MFAQFFSDNLDVVFMIYGLSFVVMAVSILIQPRKESIFKLSDILWLLAGFGLTHGLNEWLDMFSIIAVKRGGEDSGLFNLARLTILAVSYVFLLEFGRRLLLLKFKKYFTGWLTVSLSLLAAAFIFVSSQERSIWARYFLGFPGALFSAAGFICYYLDNKTILRPFKVRRFFIAAAISLAIYSALGGLVVTEAGFFPASILNNTSFLKLIGIPVQVFRAVCAAFLAWGVWSILWIFNWEIMYKLKNLRERLTHSEKLATIGEISGIIGHEFRNQLGAMRNSVYFLKMKLQDADEKIKKHLEILEGEITESNKIIEDISTFAKTRQLELKGLDLNELLLASIEKVSIPKNISVVTRLDKSLPKIKADEVQLTRVFINIILNAVEAMGEEGRLTVKAFCQDEYLNILFEDTGPGIKEEDKKIIFEPFFSTKASGIGLGLATCSFILEAHGGSIHIESELGKGTAVRVRLPIIQERNV